MAFLDASIRLHISLLRPWEIAPSFERIAVWWAVTLKHEEQLVKP
jgi:hypothetical protein